MMKSLLLSGAFFFTALAANAQCNDLFFSEYVEGSGNNKALEIYNPTANPISLGSYRMIRYSNGSLVPADNEIQPLPANASVPAYGVYVIAVNLTDPNGTGQTAPIDPALQAKTDTLLSNGCAPDPGNIRTMCFNGDDAITLEKNVGGTWQIIDIFGCIGEQPLNSTGTANPTAGWTDIAPYSSMPVGYDGSIPYFLRYWSQDNTLKRKATVTGGVTTNPAPQSFNPSVQWDSLAEDFFDSLGFHSCVCNIVGIQDVDDETKTILYPNPSSDFTHIEAAFEIRAVQLSNMLGQTILIENNALKSRKITVPTHDLPAGMYSVKVMFFNGKTSDRKLIVRP